MAPPKVRRVCRVRVKPVWLRCTSLVSSLQRFILTHKRLHCTPRCGVPYQRVQVGGRRKPKYRPVDWDISFRPQGELKSQCRRGERNVAYAAGAAPPTITGGPVKVSFDNPTMNALLAETLAAHYQTQCRVRQNIAKNGDCGVDVCSVATAGWNSGTHNNGVCNVCLVCL